MELPRRSRGDELLEPGRMTALRDRLRRIAPRHDLASVVACAFDHRTRMLPFIFADTRMAPAGIRAVGSALADIGCEKTRLVLQQWNRRFRPSQMRLDGRIPDLFMVSSMGMHEAECKELVRDARRIDPEHRPLIIVGGSHAVYEPFKIFSADPEDPAGPDIAVTGEEFVFLSLLEAVLSVRAEGEPMRSAFARARDAGMLDEIPGLVYPLGERDGIAEKLIDTGTQRLLGDLDELPHPTLGYRLLEPPSRVATLASSALPADRVRRHTPLGSLVMTFGCKFACPYCPIPAYNQRQYRTKSPDRIADEMRRINREFGLRYFFGTDDNFFNDHGRALEIAETLARAKVGVRWGTEVTVHDTLKMKEHLPLMHEAGCRGLWLGVEDLTATLVKKGQSADKTTEAFRRLRDAGICPMPMMMHHDSQPLYTRGSDYGLLNQVRLLRKSGAVSLQVLMIVPSPGSKLYNETYTSGQVFDRVGGRRVDPYMHDGNYVIASHHKHPWKKQLNILTSYSYFYNPWWLLVALLRKTKVGDKPVSAQLFGMLGNSQNIRRTLGWAFRLMFRKIERLSETPASTIPMQSVEGTHSIYATPTVEITIDKAALLSASAPRVGSTEGAAR
ncbi:MAG: B12-binding domain-containing radical SAM protein [Planctomycetes bacterium]|nr:B12-binding domain-containing radical SAM protein [Planctomycetota bacterium]